MSPQVRIAALLLAVALDAAAQDAADGQLPVYVDQEVSSDVVKATERAAQEGRWGDVLARYHRLLEENADQMVPLDEKGRAYRGVSHYVFEKMSAMPAEGIAEYRRAYDAYARSLYEDALKNRDEAGMTRVATRWFFSGSGEAASLWVAARLEERGLLAEAASCYGRVVRVYPREGVAPAWISARWALACRRAGDAEGWDLARAELLRAPDAPVSFQGRTLKASEAAARIEKVGPTAVTDSGGPWWPRLGGNNSATRRVTGTATNDVRVWQFPPRTPIEARDHRKFIENRRWPGMGIKVPFVHAHPAVTRDGTVVYSDGRTVYFLELATGDLLGTTDRETRPEEIFRQTLTDNPQVISLVTPLLHDGVAYVNRLPASVRQGVLEPKATAIVAYSIATCTQLWSTSREPALDDAWFGSPPVLHNGRLYAAVCASSVGDRTVELVVLDARTGRLIERRYLCSGSGPAGGWGNNFFITEAPMIAESGGVLYVSTNLGAVAAIRSASLDVLWLTVYAGARAPGRFPGRQQLTQRTGRGLSPIVIDGDRMCVLPGDAETYYEFDVRTGGTLLAVPLKSTPQDPILHFAGIIRPELPPGKDGAPQEPRVLAFFSSRKSASFLEMKESERNATTARQLYPISPPEEDPTGPRRGSEPDSPVVGRMVVTPQALFVPYRGGLASVSSTMKLLGSYRWEKEMAEVDAGNLMVLGDCTLTYSDLGMTCFITRRDFDARFEGVLAAGSRNWAELEKHAEVLIRNPRTWEGAILDYERLAAQADDPARAVRAQGKLAWIWKMTGDNLLASSPPDFRGAVGAYRKAIAAAPADEALGDLFRLVGDCHKKLQEWPEAIAVYQEALERYGDRVVTGANGLTRTVREFASAEIAGILRDQGAEAYREVEEKAKRLLEDLKAKEGLEDLKRWLDVFQNSSVAPAAAEILAGRLEEAGRPWEAVALLRRLAERAAGRPE
ncbi:MAG: PQQ-binding-like beta-propeller repeat protein, partial [Candidatus Brocadiae bacterium]|nr:PQQ-binding-like beta-propeller repeat protein [Candidatus Brocadiia bacterium]